MRVLDVELSEPLPPVSGGADADGVAYGSAAVLVRLHQRPLGVVRLDLTNGDVSQEALTGIVWAELAPGVVRHLEQDGLPAADRLPLDGLPAPCRSALPSDGELPFVTVVVVTADRLDRLEPCLRALLRVDYPRFEILVVDSSADDAATRALLSQLGDPRVRHLRAHAAGEAQARNSGLMFARGELVAFAADELLVDRSWLRELVAEFQLDPDVASVTGLVLPTEVAGELAASADVAPWTQGDRCVLGQSRPVELAHRLLEDARWAQGVTVNGAVRKAALEDGWRFDPHLGKGTPCRSGDDLDASIQLALAGHRLVWQPAALARRVAAPAGPDDRARLFSSYVGLSAVLVKHALAGDGRVARGVLRAVRASADERRARGRSVRRGSAGWSHVTALCLGPVAYAHSRLKTAWATA